MLFEVEKVTEQIYRISMPYVCCYLIVGKNQAALIDCGWGYGNIKEVVESITDLPITLILSHGHPDHIGGAAPFDPVYLNEKDWTMIESQSQIELRRSLMLRSVPDDFRENPDLWQEARRENYLPLGEETTFDLGNLTVLPFHLPGHTRGSMVFIIPEERIAIFGDAISHPTLVIFDNSSNIQDHYQAMIRLTQHSHLYDRVLVNHETWELSKVVLENNLQLAQNILEGKDEKIPASKRAQQLSPNGKVYLARKQKRWLPEDPRDIGNIYYREDKVEE